MIREQLYEVLDQIERTPGSEDAKAAARARLAACEDATLIVDVMREYPVSVEAAELAAERVLQLEPESESLWEALSIVYFLKDHLPPRARLRNVVRRLLELNPDNLTGLDMEAHLWQMDHPKDAAGLEAIARRMLALDEMSTRAMKHLYEAMILRGDRASARTFLEHYLRLPGSSPDVLEVHRMAGALLEKLDV